MAALIFRSRHSGSGLPGTRLAGATSTLPGKSKMGPGSGGPVKQPPEQPIIPAYTVSLKVGQRQFFGEGHTQQAAKHNAASKALAVLKVSNSMLNTYLDVN